jgi:acyl-homoserine lactone acylase PvdQ
LPPDGERALGSNQWAVAGSRTRSGHPMLLINPHVSFFGMSTYTETHLASAEGLEFSGPTRFGFMLPYMGNNAHLGWDYTDNYGDHGDLAVQSLLAVRGHRRGRIVRSPSRSPGTSSHASSRVRA